MSITSPSDLKTANITSAINWLETLSATVTDKSDKDVYLCFETDSENGLKAPLSPYELSLAHVALPWKDHRRAESLIYDLEIAWLELFDAIGTRIMDRAILDHVRKSFAALHEAFKTHSLSKPGTPKLSKGTDLLTAFKTNLNELSNSLMQISPDVELAVPAPDLSNVNDCKRFCRDLCEQIQNKLKARIHSRTQAASYMLNAKPEDLFYNECKIAQQIRKDCNWLHSTFLQNLKPLPVRKPRTLKPADKSRIKLRLVKRELKDL